MSDPKGDLFDIAYINRNRRDRVRVRSKRYPRHECPDDPDLSLINILL